MSPRLLITADDRSGAMEAAAQCADAGFVVEVCAWDGDAPAPDADGVVIDLRTRNVPVHEAVRRAERFVLRNGRPRLHKIDSTLRGNWAAEVGVLRAGSPALLIPAFPSLGRTCVGGVVRVNGVPVGETEFANDGRSPTRSSRPADYCDAVVAAGVPEVLAWLGSPGAPLCVADAESDADITAVVGAVEALPDVLVVGPAAVVGAVARASGRAGRAIPLPPPQLPAVVVCGSLHPVSRAQAAAVDGVPGVTVVSSPESRRGDPDAVVHELAARGRSAADRHAARTVVLLGGDTADAFIGGRAVRVLGSEAPGVARAVLKEDRNRDAAVELLVKPGGFGHDRTVIELLGLA